MASLGGLHLDGDALFGGDVNAAVNVSEGSAVDPGLEEVLLADHHLDTN
jgi:hypothetical protein